MSRVVPLPAANTVVDSTVSIINADGSVASIGGTAASPTAVVGNVASGAADAGAPVKVGGVYAVTLPSLSAGQRVDLQTSSTGSLRVLPNLLVAQVDSFAAGNTGGYIATANQSTAAYPVNAPFTRAGTIWYANRKPNTVARLPSAAASTNATSVKAAAGDVFAISGYNAAATVRYLKLYDKASAPTVGTDVPFATLALKPLDAFRFDFPSLFMPTGIAYAMTTGAADADTGALTAADVVGFNIFYQ